MTDPTAGSPGSRAWIARIGDERVEVDGIDALRELAASGRLRPEHYVFNPDTEQWSYARELEPLRASFAARVTPDPDAWVVQRDGRNHTLRDVSAVRQWVASGRITASTLVRHPVLAKWMRAGEILELDDLFSEHPELAPGATRQPSRAFPLMFVIIGVVLLLGGLGVFAYRRSAPEPVSQKTVVTPVTNAAPAKPKPAPRIHTFTFGEKADPATAETSSEPKPPAPTETPASAATAPPSTETNVEAAEKPRPRVIREDAEEDLYDDGDVVFKSTDAVRAQVSGDTRVLIDRSMRDRSYHVDSCPRVTSEMTTVSLDLARQSYTPCSVCKPPQ